MTQLLTGELYKKMITNAATAIENHKLELNDLNVFPIPDGDTGLNMSLTINSADKALSTVTPGTLGHVCEVSASALLRGARGNSGVILSLLFRGFSRRLKDMDCANAVELAEALSAGVESAYKAVMKPTEGTILTVSRHVAKAANEAAINESDIELVFEAALEAGAISLADTINLNPVLEKAGVIDAGGKGYMYMLEAMLKALKGEMLDRAAAKTPADKADFSQFTDEDITFTYCTEFFIERNAKQDVNRLRDFLNKRGDSIVVVDDENIIKVHVHSDEPGVILTEALTYGSLHDFKFENMREQHSDAIKNSNSSVFEAQVSPEDMKPYAIVAVCVGSGIEDVFRNLGTDRLITGGQTMNPSTEDILKGVLSAPSDVVFILPNNKNIIMAAQQCEPLTEKRIIVIPTKSIPQGISALLAIDEAEGIDDMQEVMTAAAARVITASITYAARDSTYDGMDIKEGEFIAIIDNTLNSHSANIEDVFDIVSDTLSETSPEFITIFSGRDADKNHTASLLSKVESTSPDTEVSVIDGMQPIFLYIVSAE